MSAHLPPEVIVTELPTGVRYRLPGRGLGAYRLVGLGLVVFGVALCSAPVVPTWKIVEFLRGRIPGDQVLMWLGGWMIGALLFRAGLSVAPVGLFILAGHSEIELRGGTLCAIERCGPLRWRWDRSTDDLRRFFVSEGLESLNVFGRVSIGPLGTLCVITPEWKPAVPDRNAVGGPNTRPMWLAPGYPRAWLMAIAGDLAERCAVVSPAEDSAAAVAGTSAVAALPAIPVLEAAPDFSDYEELTERPAGSRIEVERSAEGLTLIVPPSLTGAPGWSFAGGFLCFMSCAFSTTLFEAGAARDMPLGLNVLLVCVTGIGGIGFIAAQANLRRCRVELSVGGDTLTAVQSGLFGTKQRQWRHDQVADVFVRHYPDSDGPDHWELRIQPRPGEGQPLRLLAYQDVNELRWLATVLRRILECPCESPESPAPGLVVWSPMLALRSRGRRLIPAAAEPRT